MKQLWAPWRMAYIGQGAKEQGCIFCTQYRQDDLRTALVLGQTRHSVVMMNKYPYNNGHLMIAPYQHVSRLMEAGESTTEEMMRVARQTERILEEVYHPDGFNLGMNLGEAAGAGVEQHVHLHMLPRWKGDGNFMSTVGNTRIIPEALEDTYTKVKNEFLRL